MYFRLSMFKSAYIYTCIHIYIYIHTHTQTYLRTPRTIGCNISIIKDAFCTLLHASTEYTGIGYKIFGIHEILKFRYREARKVKRQASRSAGTWPYGPAPHGTEDIQMDGVGGQVGVRRHMTRMEELEVTEHDRLRLVLDSTARPAIQARTAAACRQPDQQASERQRGAAAGVAGSSGIYSG